MNLFTQLAGSSEQKLIDLADVMAQVALWSYTKWKGSSYN